MTNFCCLFGSVSFERAESLGLDQDLIYFSGLRASGSCGVADSSQSTRPLPRLLWSHTEKARSSVGGARLPSQGSWVTVLVRVVLWPGELHWLTGGHLSLDSKPQNYVFYEIASPWWSTEARSKVLRIPGPAGRIWWPLGYGFLLMAMCL